MLLIQEEENTFQSTECFSCLEDYNIFSGYGMYEDMCKSCDESTLTTFSCPECKVVLRFFGKDDPIYCKACKALLPDIIDLKDSPTQRVLYHTKKIGS